MSHEIEQYLAYGFNGHLKKPIERKNFIAVIDQYYKSKVSTKHDQESKVLDSLDETDLSDLTLSFIENLSEDKKNIENANVNNDTLGLAKTAHHLAGAAHMFGFIELAQSATDLELFIKNNSLDNNKNSNLKNDLVYFLLDEINFVQNSE